MAFPIFSVNGFNHIFSVSWFVTAELALGRRKEASKNGRFTAMARVFLHAMIHASWKGNMLSAEPNSAQELAAIAIRLLVEELGEEKGRRYARREFARYRRGYRGAGRDTDGPAR